MSQHYLLSYLKDHLAGAEAGLRRFEQATKKNHGTGVGDSLARVTEEVRKDRQVLLKLCRKLGAKPARFRRAGALVGEKAARLKLNLHYTPLSRVEDLEALLLGVTGKLSLWRALRELSKTDRALQLDYELLIARAQGQQLELEKLRRQAARLAFARGAAERPALRERTV